MAGHIHAIILLACPVVTGVILWRASLRRRPSVRHILIAAILAALPMYIASTPHMCNEGQAWMQWILPGACLFVLLVSLSGAAIRRITACAMALAMFGLTCHHGEFVHTSEWTGNPENRTTERECESCVNGALRLLAGKPECADVEFEAGWLRDLTIWPALKEIARDEFPRFDFENPHRQIAIPQWHSGITRLYKQGSVSADYWYCGGVLKNGEVVVR